MENLVISAFDPCFKVRINFDAIGVDAIRALNYSFLILSFPEDLYEKYLYIILLQKPLAELG
jgi:hypothetical protein